MGWKREQRQLSYVHIVLFFGRAQNGEMHQINGAVGLKQVAPCALTRMRFARYQQNAQPVAHAVNLHHSLIVSGA